MTTTQSTGSHRISWLVTGMVFGAMTLGAATWIWNRMDATGPEPTEATSAGAGMDMAGMDMGADQAGATTNMGDMGEGAAVRITPDQIRQFGITFGAVEERDLEARIRTVGVVEVDETRLVDITTKFAGYVENLYADFTGMAVEQGAKLLDVYAPDLVAAQEEVLLARNLQETVGAISLPGVTTEPVDLEATARRRLSLWDIDDDQIIDLLAEGTPSRTLSLSSPITGIVLEKSVVPGAAFDAGQTLFRLADLSEVWIDIEVRETDAAFVRLGSTAEVRLTAYPGETFPGSVDFIYPTVDERTRSLRARVVVANPTGQIRPGMYATVHVTTPQSRALAVPSDAIVWTGERNLLFVQEPGGRLRPVEAEIGATVGDYVVILAGVEAGERVVLSAQYLIDAEANIGAIMRSMMSMMGSGDMAGMDMDGMDMGGMDMGGGDMGGMDMGDESPGGMDGMSMPMDTTSSPDPSGR
jgi:membrane fusion protein, copper/silver efflux system